MAATHTELDNAARLRAAGKHRQALAVLEAIDKCAVDDAELCFQVGLTRYHLGELQPAIASFQQYLKARPASEAGWLNIGACYNEYGDQKRAIDAYQKVLDINPANPSVWGNLAKAWHDDGEHETAIYCYRRALAIKRTPQNLRGLALAWRKCGRFDRSGDLLEEALRINPDDARAHFGMAMNAFYTEDYETALREYEWRIHLPRQQNFRRDHQALFAQPVWKGEALEDQTLLIYTEQGFGDNLQFCRFIPMARQRAKRIVMYARPGLGELFRANFDIAEITEDINRLPTFDRQVSLLSLPHLLDPGLESLKEAKAYLRTPQGHPSPPLREEGKLNVGLVWGAEQLGYEYDNKKVPLETFKSLLTLPDINWVSLQVGGDRDDLETTGFDKLLYDAGKDFRNFADTAAAIEQLDLVISVDTAVAHLAGAMGKPVWVLLPKYADWRWGHNRQRTQWYPHSRLLNQLCAGRRTEVIDHLEICLREHLPPFV